MSAPPDYGSRLLFLNATTAGWTPAPLHELVRAKVNIAPWVAAHLTERAPFRQSHSPWRLLEVDDSLEGTRARAGLIAWAFLYRFPKNHEWVFDVALHTIAESLVEGFEPDNWCYMAPVSPSFRWGRADNWKLGEDAKVFKQRIRRHFHLAVNQYCREVAHARAEHKRNPEQHARWLVRRLAGESWKEIARSPNDPEERLRAEDPAGEANLVQKNTTAFALRIGFDRADLRKTSKLR